MNQRIDNLRAALEREHLDALLISSEQNRFYLSGFSGSAGFLLITTEQIVLLSDFRYREQAAVEAPDWEFRLIQQPEMPELKLIANTIADYGMQRVGFEAGQMTVSTHQLLLAQLSEHAPGNTLVATNGLVEALRTVKDADELAKLERAVTITDQAFAQIRTLMRPTMTEREVAWELEKAMREGGADALAFTIIIAAGPNGARPHARPGNDQIGVGRPIVMDFGAKIGGYHGDMTRTVILGQPDEQFERIYAQVLAAQQHASQNVRAGLLGKQGDALARDLIDAAGFADNFGHGLGHGVGLNIHELPSLRKGNEDPLPVGAVFSIEPGIYLPEWGGVRIEDLVTLTETGVRTLTQSTKDPVIALD